jgi:glycosyltransferase involved in cell wall biosynthesis
MAREGLHNLFCHYQRLRIKHRAKVVVIASYLSDEQMLELAEASTFYLNTSLAEGACLPLQDFLAAGRPGIAPAHTAMSEYIDDELAFVVDSRSEPTHWPWDPERRPATVWNRVLRPSLERQLRASYETVKDDARHYRQMAACGRERMNALASVESVWPKLAGALSTL